MKLELPHRRKIWENHEVKFSIIHILRDDIEKKKSINKRIKKTKKNCNEKNEGQI